MNKSAILERKLQEQKIKNFAKSINGTSDFNLVSSLPSEFPGPSIIVSLTENIKPNTSFLYPDFRSEAIKWMATKIDNKIIYPCNYNLFLMFNVLNKNIFMNSLIEKERSPEVVIYNKYNATIITSTLIENHLLCYNLDTKVISNIK